MQNTKNNGDYPPNAGKHFYQQFFNEEIYKVKTASKEPLEIDKNEEEFKDSIITASGDLTSKTLILFREKQEAIPTGSKKLLLDNILKAIGLSFEEVAWINAFHYPEATWRDFTLATNAEKFIVFGLPAKQSPGNAQAGQIYTFNGRKSITTIDLETLEKDAAAKKQFWGLLKELYVQ